MLANFIKTRRNEINMKNISLILRMTLGTWLLTHGSSYFFGMPEMLADNMTHLMKTMKDINLLPPLKVIEILSGVALLTNTCIPAALLAALMVSPFFIVNDILVSKSTFGILRSIASLGLNLFLILGFIKAYLPIFACNSGVTKHFVFHVARLYVGAWMFFWGINYFHEMVRLDLGADKEAIGFFTVLITSRLFLFAKIFEVVGGAILLTNRFVPLGIMICLPVSFIVGFNDLYVSKLIIPHIVGGVLLAGNLFLLYGYREHFCQLLTTPELSATFNLAKEASVEFYSSSQQHRTY